MNEALQPEDLEFFWDSEPYPRRLVVKYRCPFCSRIKHKFVHERVEDGGLSGCVNCSQMTLLPVGCRGEFWQQSY